MLPITVQAERPATIGPSREWATIYATTVVGILRIAQIVFVLIAFLCSVCAGSSYNGSGWVNFVTISAFISVVVWFVLHIMNVLPQHIVNQYIEVIMYAVYTLFLLIAAIVVAAGAGSNASYGASAFFCFLSLVLWAVDTVLQFLRVRTTWSSSSAAGATGQPSAFTVESGTASTGANTDSTAVHY